MKLEDRLLLDGVLEKMNSLVRPKGAGEISFDTLAAISREKEGWVGSLLQALLQAVESNVEDDKAEQHLQEVAAIALKWTLHLRKNRENILGLPEAGDVVTVRVPEHRLRYLGTVTSNGQIYIAFLGKHFNAGDVEIIPQKKSAPKKSESSLDFQHAIDNQMEFLRNRVFEKKS